MAQVKFHKFVAALPAELEADAIYYVRAGAGFDIYVTNSSGTVVAYPLNVGGAGQGFFRTEPISATATGQTVFTVPGGYTPGAVIVSLNGATLPPADYTATDGATVVLASGAGIVTGSSLLVYVLSAFEVADALPLGGTAADSSKLGGQLPSHYATQADLAGVSPGPEFYKRANILGTVSQSVGVPTGAIIERGSNANGEYVRYADGTQICWRTVTYTGPINTPFGSVYNGSVVAASSFPASFVDAPATAQLVRSITAGDPWLIGSNQRPTTNTQWGGFYVLNPLAISFTVTAVVSLAAIGRWY